MGNIFSIRLTDEDKIHLQQRMDETGKNATEVFKSAIYFTKIDADLVDEIISNIGYYASEKDLEGIKVRNIMKNLVREKHWKFR